MDGTFELNKPGWYTVQQFQVNDFLNDKLTSEEYGRWYSVQFEADAETFLWQTKSEPIKGEKYWGWLEKTKSGKATKFKWDKQNAPGKAADAGGQAKASEYEPGTNARWAIGLAYRAHLQVTGTPDDARGEFPFDMVFLHASELVKMFDKVKSGESSGYADAKATAKMLKARVLTDEYGDMPEDMND